MTYQRLCVVCLLLVCCLLLPGAARGGDPHPPQINVTFLATPAPLVQDGTVRLYYEMVITNFAGDSYILDAVTARQGQSVQGLGASHSRR
jgi:hypothetical protein